MAQQVRSDDTGARNGLTDARGRTLHRGKDSDRERQLFRRRLLIALTLVSIVVLFLIGRLAQLQVLQHQHFATLSESNRVRLQPLAPTRGLIYDRNGVLLAENLPSHRLEIIPEEVNDLPATLRQLGQLIDISPADLERFHRLEHAAPPYTGIPLRFDLSDAEVARLAVELYRFPGVSIKADLKRYYPLGRHTAHIVGYVGRIDEQDLQTIDASQYAGTTHIGKTGIEKAYENELHGQVGYQQVETNAQGRVLRVISQTPPVPGKDLYLTLDIHFQEIAEQALGDYSGSIVAIDPRNGEVLALVSNPSFNPNLFVNGIDAESYHTLSHSPERPLFNRAVQGLYPPGSTIKPFMALAGLESGTIDQNHTVYCPGYFQLPGQKHKFRDWKRGGHGLTGLNKAIVESCDVYFYELGLSLGIDRIHGYLTGFGFGVPTGIDLSGEKSGLVPSSAWKEHTYHKAWYAGETVNTAIGQGYMLVTPLQLAAATAALAMRGERFRPHLVYAQRGQGSQRRQLLPEVKLVPVKVRDPSDWAYVIHAMTEVVSSVHGTAHHIAHGLRYSIAGKTGTAQVFSLDEGQQYHARELARRLRDNALFIAFAPADAPRIAVAVIVEHAAGGGGSVAAPIARQVLDAYLLGDSS